MEIGRIIAYFPLAFLLLFYILPFYILTDVSFNATIFSKPPQYYPLNPSLEGYIYMLTQSTSSIWIINSFIYSASVTVGVLFVSTLAGYAFSRLVFPGRTLLFWLVLVGMMTPTVILYIPLYITLSNLNMLNSYAGVILPLMVSPFSVFLVKQALDSVPRDYEEAALVDGSSTLQILFNVLLPIIKPVLYTVGLFNFIWTWNNWLWPLFVSSSPFIFNLPVAVFMVSFSWTAVSYPNLAAAAIISMVVPLLLYIFALEYFIKGVIIAGLKR